MAWTFFWVEDSQFALFFCCVENVKGKQASLVFFREKDLVRKCSTVSYLLSHIIWYYVVIWRISLKSNVFWRFLVYQCCWPVLVLVHGGPLNVDAWVEEDCTHGRRPADTCTQRGTCGSSVNQALKLFSVVFQGGFYHSVRKPGNRQGNTGGKKR